MTKQKLNKGINIGLWLAQGILAAMFLLAGFTKSVTPLEELAYSMPWVNDASPFIVRFAGISEVAGALGLILPAAFRIKPNLTPWAAIGLMAIMVLAMVLHISRGEYQMLGINTVLLVLGAFIAWGRSKKAIIQPK